MKPESQAVREARRRVRDAADHMRRMNAAAPGGYPLLVAVAGLLDGIRNVRHYGAGQHHRGILGGWSVHCSCGSGTWVEMDGEPTPLCPALQRALAVAEAYDPTGTTAGTDQTETAA
jgi:hypothetical protein